MADGLERSDPAGAPEVDDRGWIHPADGADAGFRIFGADGDPLSTVTRISPGVVIENFPRMLIVVT